MAISTEVNGGIFILVGTAFGHTCPRRYQFVGICSTPDAVTIVQQQITGTRIHTFHVDLIVDGIRSRTCGNTTAWCGWSQEQATQTWCACCCWTRARGTIDWCITIIAVICRLISVWWACTHTGICCIIIILRIRGSRNTTRAYFWLIPTLITSRITRNAGLRVDVLVSTWGTTIHTSWSSRVIVLGRCAWSYGTILSIKSWHAVTHTPGAKAILRTPIGTQLPRLRAKTLKHRTLKISIQSTNCFLSSFLRTQTKQSVRANSKLNGTITCMADIGITARSRLIRNTNGAQGWLHTKCINLILLESVGLITVISAAFIHTMKILSE